MSLLTICQSVLREIGGINVPSSIVGSTDPTAVQLLALAKRSLRTIAQDYKWQVLLTTHTFTTADGTGTYVLPTDFHRFANLTSWDRTNGRYIEGPLNAMKWEALRSGNLTAVSAWKYFRIAGNLFAIYPTPTAVETIAYQYFSKYAITGKETYSDDADAPLLDEDLLTIDLRWRWLQAKGLDFASERTEFLGRLNALIAKDGAKDGIRFGGPKRVFPAGNLPETDFG